MVVCVFTVVWEYVFFVVKYRDLVIVRDISIISNGTLVVVSMHPMYCSLFGDIFQEKPIEELVLLSNVGLSILYTQCIKFVLDCCHSSLVYLIYCINIVL